MALDIVRSGEYKFPCGTVRFFPCPSGVIRIVALDESGEWVAEWSCREQHFSEQHLENIQAFVAETAGRIVAVT